MGFITDFTEPFKHPYSTSMGRSKSNPMVKYEADDKQENEDEANIKVRVQVIEPINSPFTKMTLALGLLAADELGVIELTTSNRKERKKK